MHYASSVVILWNVMVPLHKLLPPAELNTNVRGTLSLSQKSHCNHTQRNGTDGQSLARELGKGLYLLIDNR